MYLVFTVWSSQSSLGHVIMVSDVDLPSQPLNEETARFIAAIRSFLYRSTSETTRSFWAFARSQSVWCGKQSRLRSFSVSRADSNAAIRPFCPYDVYDAKWVEYMVEQSMSNVVAANTLLIPCAQGEHSWVVAENTFRMP